MLDFDGVDDLATLGLGAIPATPNDLSVVALVSIDTVSRWNNIFDMESAANAARWGLTVTAGNALRLANSGAFSEGLTIGAGPQLLAATRASGAAATLYKYEYATGTLTSATGGALANETLASAKVVLGAFTSSSDFFDGKMKAVGMWARVLSAAEVQALALTLQAWYSFAPAAGWLLDQDAITQKILDFTGGGANESSRVGTAVSTVSLPTFGYGAPIIVPTRPAAAAGVALQAAIAGTGTTAPSLTVQTALQAAVAGQGVVAAGATLTEALQAAIAGTGSLAAAAALQEALNAVVFGQAQIVFGLTAQQALQAVVAGDASIIATLDVTGAGGAVVIVDSRDHQIYIATNVF